MADHSGNSAEKQLRICRPPSFLTRSTPPKKRATTCGSHAGRSNVIAARARDRAPPGSGRAGGRCISASTSSMPSTPRETMMAIKTDGFVYLEELTEETLRTLFEALYLPIDEWRRLLRLTRTDMRHWVRDGGGPRRVYICARSGRKCLFGADVRAAIEACAEPHGAENV